MDIKDILYNISYQIRDGSTWKSWILVNNAIYKVSLLLPFKKIGLCNHLLSLIYHFPYEKWNEWELTKSPHLYNYYIENSKGFYIRSLSRNPRLTWEFILEHVDKHWDWDFISMHPCVKWEHIIENPTYRWNVNVCLNPNITWENMMSTSFKHSWIDWTLISFNPNITIEIINKHPNSPWNWSSLSQNPNITFDFIMQNMDKGWNWYAISMHHNITFEFIIQNPDHPWRWQGISQNPNITINHVIQNPTKKWYWGVLSKHPNITFEYIRQNPDYKWDFDYVSQNPNITYDIVVQNPGIWDFGMMSNNTFRVR